MDNAEDVDVVVPMQNLIEYGKNYRKKTSSLWNYYSDEPINPPGDNNNADTITNSKSFNYKTSTMAKIQDNANNDNNTKDLNLLFH